MARGNLAGGEAQAVLEAQAMMAQDPELIADVERRITVGSTAERAVYDAFAAYRARVAGAGGALGGGVSRRGGWPARDAERTGSGPRWWAGRTRAPPNSAEPYVLTARDLAPAD